MDYSFLTSLTLVDTGRLRQPKERNPQGLTLRVFANGEVYPSKELVEKYNLEFVGKDSTEKANGFDVVDSSEWPPMAAHPRMILFGVTPKTEAKVDLFGSCRYDSENKPKSSVMTQGATSELLLNLVRSMGLLNEDQKYVDLVILAQYPINPVGGISNIPKTVERGVNKGERTYERREDVTFYPVTSTEEFEKMNNSAVTANVTAEQVTNTVETV